MKTKMMLYAIGCAFIGFTAYAQTWTPAERSHFGVDGFETADPFLNTANWTATRTSTPVEWKPYFTLQSEEGISFSLDTTTVIPDAMVPSVNIANDGRIILGFASPQGGRGQATTTDTGKTFVPLTGYAKAEAGDGAFIYLPDGRTRFVAEEPLPTSTPQRHKSRLVSWISSDGINWNREPGVRYQPGAEDDSIASVPVALQVADSLWRLYYVGDWYRTNGVRTALSTDWGWTWEAESCGNILRKNDIDPHPVYLTDGGIRIYHRYLQQGQGGIAFTDGEGLIFDTTKTKILLPDSKGGQNLLLDPAVVKFPNGRVACFIGALPRLNQPGNPKIIVAWATTPPAAPTLVSPDDSATGVSTSPTLFWNSSAQATTYHLQLSTVSTFASTVFDDSTLTDTSKQVGLLTNSTTYFWRVSAKNTSGTSSFSSARSFTTIDNTTGAEVIGNEVLAEFALSQNYPNPFNPSTTIRFSLPQREPVTLKVFDVLGNEVATMVDEELNAGEHVIVFNADSLASGVYFYRMQVGGYMQQKKMLVVR